MPKIAKTLKFSANCQENENTRILRVVIFAGLPYSTHFRAKKAPFRALNFRNSRTRKSDFLVQNEENHLLHQLSRRCIWVIQSLTFGIYFPKF